MSRGLVTVDDDDRGDAPDSPWTVSCLKCQEGVSFWLVESDAHLAAYRHVLAHEQGHYPEEPE